MPEASSFFCVVVTSCAWLADVVRWESKEYLEQIHFQSEPFKKLGVEMAEQGIDLSKFLSTYYEQDIGF
jgi:hypothetical protein